MRLINRKSAKAEGLVRYFTGKPCIAGHEAERFVSTRGCVVCMAAKSTLWKAENPEKVAAQKLAWCASNPEHIKALKAAAHRRKPESQAKRSRAWFLKNREKANKATADWQKRNMGKATAWAARRRAALLQRTAKWADHGVIDAFYRLAKVYREHAGLEVVVDHVIPLRGKRVSGLHTHDNLNIIDRRLNKAKSNHFDIF